MQEHEAAGLFPPMSEAEFEALVADISENGLREPIVMFSGKILDGRHRWRACKRLNLSPTIVEWDGGGSPMAFVASMNLHRRHLNEAQRAMIAAKIANLKSGQRADLKRKGDQGAVKTAPAVSQKDAAALLNVGRTTVQEAKTVLDRGTEEEILAVERGEIGVGPLAREIRRGVPSAVRAGNREASLAQTGKNPERIQRQQLNAKVYREVRDAVVNLSGLPRPADVVKIVRAQDRGVVGPKLEAAMYWLMEFSDEWNRQKIEEKSAVPANHHANAGNGDGPAGEEHPQSAA